MPKRTNDEIQRDVQLVLRALRSKRRGLSRGEVAIMTSLPRARVSDALIRLRTSGTIQIEGDKALARYHLTTAPKKDR